MSWGGRKTEPEDQVVSIHCGHHQGCGWSLTSTNEDWVPDDLYVFYEKHFAMAHPPAQEESKSRVSLEEVESFITPAKKRKPYVPVVVPQTEAEWKEWEKAQARVGRAPGKSTEASKQ